MKKLYLVILILIPFMLFAEEKKIPVEVIELLDQQMVHKVLGKKEIGDGTYYVIDSSDDYAAAVAFVGIAQEGPVVYSYSETPWPLNKKPALEEAYRFFLEFWVDREIKGYPNGIEDINSFLEQDPKAYDHLGQDYKDLMRARGIKFAIEPTVR